MTKPTLFLLAALVVALDQLAKAWAVARLPLDVTSRALVPGVLYLTRSANTGSAFGMFPGSSLVLAGVAVVIAGAITTFVARARPPLPAWLAVSLALPLGGAIGNLIDRVRLGYVVDFLDLRTASYHWFIFNVADAAICLGVALLAAGSLRQPSGDAPGAASGNNPAAGASRMHR